MILPGPGGRAGVCNLPPGVSTKLFDETMGNAVGSLRAADRQGSPVGRLEKGANALSVKMVFPLQRHACFAPASASRGYREPRPLSIVNKKQKADDGQHMHAGSTPISTHKTNTTRCARRSRFPSKIWAGGGGRSLGTGRVVVMTKMKLCKLCTATRPHSNSELHNKNLYTSKI